MGKDISIDFTEDDLVGNIGSAETFENHQVGGFGTVLGVDEDVGSS